MGTINELNTTDTLADDDKLVLWKTQAGATRAITAEDAKAYFDTGGGGGGSGIRVEDEGATVVAAATALNFVGAGVAVTNAGFNEATVSIASGVPEAPVDGGYYARRNSGWSVFTPGGGGGSFQPLDATLTAIAGLTTAAGDFIEATGLDTVRTRKLTLDTYAELTAIGAAARFDDMKVYVAGRAEPGDGAEGWWYYDAASSATANAGTILAPDAGSGRWLRALVGGVLNVKWFGAKGDGVADDTAAALATIAAIPTAGLFPGGVVFFPRGQYLIGSTLSLQSYTTLEGEGRTTTRLTFDAQTSGPGINGATAQTFFPGVRGMHIEGTFSHGIHANYWTNFFIRDVYILASRSDGLRIDGGAYMGELTEVWARQCTGTGFNIAGFCTSITGRDCFAETNTGDGWRINNTIYSSFLSCGSDTSAGGYGYRISNVRNVKFIACGAERNEKSGFRLESSTAIISGAVYADVKELVLDSCFSWENGQDATSASFLESSSLNSREIDVTVLEPFDDNPVSTVSFQANGETRIVRHGGTLEGSIGLSDNATCWNKDARAVPAFGQHFIGGNHDTYVNSILAQRVGAAGTTFRGSTTGSAAFNFITTSTAVGSMGIALKTGDTNVDARDYGFFIGDVSRGDLTLRRSATQGGNPIAGGVVMRFNPAGQVSFGSAVPVATVTVNGALAIADGISAPATQSGWAQIYVDTADGDLKVKFGDGTVKTIVTDT